jgi:hypothetical protein
VTKETGTPGSPARNVTTWLTLAAAPVFALMALIAATDPPPLALCASGAGLLPIDGMIVMYLLMSLFHLPPWLRLVRRRLPWVQLHDEY